MKKIKLDIQGMTCSACSARVSRIINDINGTYNVNVNLLSNTVEFDLDEDKTSLKVISNHIIRAGYSVKNTNITEQMENNNTYIYKSMSEKTRLLISILFTIPLFLVSVGHMLKIPFISFLSEWENSLCFSFTLFILLLPVVFVNFKYFEMGFKSLFQGTPNMDSLVAIGSTSAILYGVFAIYKIGYGLGHNDIKMVEKFSQDLYFDSAGMILTLITLGKYFESSAKKQTSKAIRKLMNLTPQMAIVEKTTPSNTITENKEDIELVKTPVAKISIGDIIIVKAGENIPVDGVVVHGSGSIDVSSLTGESIPIEKNIGDSVSAGTVVFAGYIKIKAEKIGKDTTIAQIITLVENASSSKAPIARLADTISSFFVPIVIAIACISTLAWISAGCNIEFAISIGISVLVISCPCALGLATPTAVMVGIGKLASFGILIKSATALQVSQHLECVILDKTGTITEGKPSVTDIIDISCDKKKILQIIASLEQDSSHPIALGILAKSSDENIELLPVTNFKGVSGTGIFGEIEGQKYFLGNSKMISENTDIVISAKVAFRVDNYLNDGKTVLYLSNEKELLGIIAVADTIKPTSKTAIKQLKDKGIEVHMLTGDNKKTARYIANQVGIEKVCAGVLPQEKQDYILALKSKKKTVAMVGDGINDAVALASADIGIAIGAGTDIAIESADIVLIQNDLCDISRTLHISHHVMNNIKQNLFWAFFYNSICIPLAGGLFIPLFAIKLHPMVSAVAMSLSSIFVVLNALRLNRLKRD